MEPSGRGQALLESALIAALLWAAHAGLRALGVPMVLSAMATLVMLIPCTWLLRRQGLRWKDLGFGRISHPWRTIAWSLGLFVILSLIPPLVSAPLASLLGLPQRHLGMFANLTGNLPLYLLMLVAVGWGAAGFGEELIYRGYLFRRLSDALGGTRAGTCGALAIQAAVFGLGHVYLGPRGVLDAVCVAVFSAAAYLANGRDLWPLIIAHGLVDTVGLTLIFLGLGHG